MYYTFTFSAEGLRKLTLLVELSEKGEEKKDVIICITGIVTYFSRTISCRPMGRPLLATWVVNSYLSNLRSYLSYLRSYLSNPCSYLSNFGYYLSNLSNGHFSEQPW